MQNLLRTIVISTLLSSSFAMAAWRQASESELKALIPARASVEKERIETEFRTASGITNGKGKFVAGVVLITAGYAAEGKYSNFLIVQSPVKIGTIALQPGEYVFGWRRKDDDSLQVKFYDAHSGQLLGDMDAHRLSRTGKIESFKISSAGDKGLIQIGRFGMNYSLGE
jgi:hypothetical protein